MGFRFSFSSVAQSCPTLCNAMNGSMPGLLVHHLLPESTQTHVHRVSYAIQPSHPLSSPSPLALNLSQHQGLFKWVSSSSGDQGIGVLASTSVLPMNTQDWSSQLNSVQPLSRVWLFATPWIAARQASLSITNSQSLLKLMSIELVMPPNHLILCCPLLLLPPIPPSIRVFSNESALHMR